MRHSHRYASLLPTLLALALSASAAPSRKPAHGNHRSHPKVKAARPSRPPEPVFLPAEANDFSGFPHLVAKGAGSSVLRAQVLLDRAHFPVGEIDGRYGLNTRRAVAAYNAAHGLKGGEDVDEATWAGLNHHPQPVIVPYSIAPEDVAGPFVQIPKEMVDKAKLPALEYESAIERLGEKFHASPKILRALNPGVTFNTGVVIQVPGVDRPQLPRAASVHVKEADRSVEAVDGAGRVMARYPATVGSDHDPLPIGTAKIMGLRWSPKFNYNPDLFWDAEPGDKKVQIPAGPNSPVGVVWIDLSLPHYGIHGSPEPATISRTESHGCIRLTNWDATELAHLIHPGTPAILEK